MSRTPRNVLILGSRGQIGSALSSHLSNKGFVVRGLDIQNSTNEDLRVFNNHELSDAISESDFVFFLAFDVGGSHYLEKYQDSFEFIMNNMKIQINIFEILKNTKKPFLYASSQMANMHFSSYGQLKSVGEKLTTATMGKVVHFWNVYGVERVQEKYHVVSDFIDMALKKGKIEMRTDGNEMRDFLYVDDCCQALEKVMLLFDSLEDSIPLHIARGKFTRIIEVAQIVGNLLGATVLPGKSNDSVQRNVLNEPSLAIRKYWKPTIDLTEGISRIARSMQH